MRLIDADGIHYTRLLSRYGLDMELVSKAAIDDMPTVDAEPVRHGYWIPQDNTHTKFMCSDCKGRNHDGSGKYCSECGCKMDTEVNNDGSNSAEY